MPYFPTPINYQPQIDAINTQIGTIMTALRNPSTVNQTDYQLITGTATTLGAPLPIPAANKNSETYTRLLTASLTDFSYSANQAGRIIQQAFNSAVGSAAFVYTITAQTGETFETPDLGTVSTFTLAAGETRTFVNASTTVWREV